MSVASPVSVFAGVSSVGFSGSRSPSAAVAAALAAVEFVDFHQQFVRLPSKRPNWRGQDWLDRIAELTKSLVIERRSFGGRVES